MTIATIRVMSGFTEKGTKHQFRTTKRLRAGDLKVAIARLKAAVIRAGIEGNLSEEAVQNALYFWLMEKDLELLGKELIPYVQRWREIWAKVSPADKEKMAGKKKSKDFPVISQEELAPDPPPDEGLASDQTDPKPKRGGKGKG